MNEVSDATRQLIEALKTERDDLKLQLHLASLDAKEEIQEDWQKLEHKWAQLKASAKRLGHEVNVVTHALEEDFEGLAEEWGDLSEGIMQDIRDGYGRIRDKLGPGSH